MNKSYLRFFAVSLAVHFAVFFLVYPAPTMRTSDPQSIRVSLLDNQPQVIQPARKPAPTSVAKSPAIVARKDPAPAREVAQRRDRRQAQPEIIARADPTPPPPPPAPAPAPREIIPEQSVIAERPLPTLKELLPPIGWSSSSRNNAPVNLDTRDPIYVSYFTRIKQLIESQWEYPELAQRYGLQGKLAVEFTIGAHGQLERLRVIRSSGSQLLDEEAVRAIKAAAPFPPIPTWIKPNPLPIAAAMEYHDSRLDYRFAR